MLKKLISYLVVNSSYFKNLIAITLYKFGLMPDQYKGKAKSLFFKEKYKKKFLKSKLTYNKRGFYYLDPMPSNKFLEEYYEKVYWLARYDLNYPVRSRDIEHFKMIIGFYKEFNKSPKKILNFGSGHGGASYLFHAANHVIYNYDYETTKKNTSDERWHSINSLDKIDFKFDLIYGSHSLEHVNNIDETMKKFQDISHDKTIFFFEVPNHYYRKNINPPHTYYFTREFFSNSFEKVDFCKTFVNNEMAEKDTGYVIRFHTRSNLKLFKNI
jgi:predicted SAM-dependent methyltransferase